MTTTRIAAALAAPDAAWIVQANGHLCSPTLSVREGRREVDRVGQWPSGVVVGPIDRARPEYQAHRRALSERLGLPLGESL